MRLRIRSVEYTRLRDIKDVPTKLKEEDPSFFVETFNGLPVGKGIPLRYSVWTLVALLVNREGDIFLSERVNHSEVKLLTKAGFTSEVQGSAKVWKRKSR